MKESEMLMVVTGTLNAIYDKNKKSFRPSKFRDVSIDISVSEEGHKKLHNLWSGQEVRIIIRRRGNRNGKG